MPCVGFVEKVALCPERLVGNVWVKCNSEDRVIELVGVPEGLINSTAASCSVNWAGALSPALKVMTRLEILQLNVLPGNVSIARGDGSMSIMPLQKFAAQCTQLVWPGGNISGTIPTEWTALRASRIDFSGNGNLRGPIPVSWVDIGTQVRTSGTQLATPEVKCSFDCLDPSLTGKQRDKCGLWYQLERMKGRKDWLPPCKEYVFSPHDVCNRWVHSLKLNCDKEGRITSLSVWPHVEDSHKHVIMPSSDAAPVPPCQVVFEGTLAPEVSAMDHLTFIDFAVVMTVQSKYQCSPYVWMGANITGTIPDSWGALNISLAWFNGNQALYGTVPSSWANTATDVWISGTQITLGTTTCALDCFDQALTGPQRDKCGVWYQLSSLRSRPYWLPNCVDYVLGTSSLCQVHSSLLDITCNSEGRVEALTLHPYVHAGNAPVGPWEDDEYRSCKVFLEGTLAPQLGALERMVEISVTVTDFRHKFHCDEISWNGRNFTGSIPKEWSKLAPVKVDFGGNSLLHGEIPLSWADTACVRVYNTLLKNGGFGEDCIIDCFSRQLTGQQRDKCGIWHQINRMRYRQYWLPPCRQYILGKRDLCTMVDYELGVLVDCEEGERVVNVLLLPTVWDERDGMEMTPNPRYEDSNQVDAERCSMRLETNLAPEIGALDKLRYFGAPLPPWGDLINGEYQWYNCNTVEWGGANVTDSIPYEWVKAQDLSFLEFTGNNRLRGRLPGEFIRMQEDDSTIIMLNGTRVEIPRFSAARKDSLCKLSQRKNSSLEIWTPQNTALVFSTNIIKNDSDGFAFQSHGLRFTSINGGDVFYCGKNSEAIPQAAAVWGVFLIMLVILTVARAIHWRRGEARKAQAAMAQGPAVEWAWPRGSLQAKWQSLKATWGGPFFAAFSVYDIITDVLLAISMYPSWTTWLVVVGLSLPSVICAAAISILGVPQYQHHLTSPVVYVSAVLLFPVVAFLFPLLVVFLVLNSMLGLNLRLPAVLHRLNVDRLSKLFSGVTACTEDIFVSVFTTAGFVLMALSPWKMNKSNVYFAVWTFWLSVVTSMCHMAICWWDGVGNLLEYGNLTWVTQSFTGLYDGVSSFEGARVGKGGNGKGKTTVGDPGTQLAPEEGAKGAPFYQIAAPQDHRAASDQEATLTPLSGASGDYAALPGASFRSLGSQARWHHGRFYPSDSATEGGGATGIFQGPSDDQVIIRMS